MSSALVRSRDLEHAAVPESANVRFTALRQSGEPMDLRFLRLNAAGVVLDEECLPHDVYDGLGATVALLHARGEPVPLPAATTKRPTTLSTLLQVRPFVRDARVPAPQYRVTADWDVKDRRTSVSALWDATATAQLVGHARAQGVRLTALVLAHADRVLAAALLVPHTPRRWMVPVNTRSAGSTTLGNDAGVVFVPVDDGISAQQAHAALRSRIDAGRQHVPRLLSRVSSALLSRDARVRAVQHFSPDKVGFAFLTNLGVWSTQDRWALVPPVNRRTPTALSMITAHGCLSMTLTMHGCLGNDAAATHDCMQQLAHALHDGARPSAVFNVNDVAAG